MNVSSGSGSAPKATSSSSSSSKGDSSSSSSKPQGTSSTQSSAASSTPPSGADKPRTTSGSTAPGAKDGMDASKPSPVNLNGSPPKAGLKPPSAADAQQVSKLGSGDQLKLKTSAGVNAGQTSAQTESSVAVKKNDDGKYEVSADRSTAVSAGLDVPREPSAPGSPSANTTPSTQGQQGQPGQPRGPIIDTAPKPQTGSQPGLSLPKPGGIVSLPGGPSIQVQGGITGSTSNSTSSTTSDSPFLSGRPLIDRNAATSSSTSTSTQPPAREEKAPEVQVGAKTGSTVTYTFDKPEDAARASEILTSGRVASPDEASAMRSALSSQEVKFASTAKGEGNGLSAEEAGTTSLKVKYDNGGHVNGTELKAEFEVSGDTTLRGVNLKAGDKLSFTTIDDGGKISHETAAELSGVAKAPGDGFVSGVDGAKTEYKFSPQGTEVSSFVTSSAGLDVPLGPLSLGAGVELEDRVYHSVNGVAQG